MRSIRANAPTFQQPNHWLNGLVRYKYVFVLNIAYLHYDNADWPSLMDYIVLQRSPQPNGSY